MALARRDGLQASPGIEPGPAWQGCGVSCCATKHNGLSHVACPQAAAKALLVAPLHATPVMSCAHLPCACGLLLTACSNKPHAQQPLASAVTAGAVTTGVQVRRVAAQCVVLAPAHPVWARRLAAPLAQRRWVARPPPEGAPSTPALGSCAAGQRCACCCVCWSRLASHRLANPIPPGWRGCSSGARQ